MMAVAWRFLLIRHFDLCVFFWSVFLGGWGEDLGFLCG